MRKIGLLGGSFDPVHHGHIEMAKQAYRQLGLDEVWFVLSADTPLKDRKLSSYSDRKKMLQMALYPYRKFKASYVEEQSKSKNYTVDTIRILKKQYPKTVFYFLLGADQIEQLSLWKEIDYLQEEVQLCAFERKGYERKSLYKLRYLDMEAMQVSSTKIRQGNLQYVHPKVKKYIVRHFLYPDIVKQAIGAKRYEHSVSVAEVCQSLAKTYCLDETLAYMCGIYHDINKEFYYLDLKKGEQILTTLWPEMVHQNKNIWHGPLGAFVVKHRFGVCESKVLHAIEHHVLGDCDEIYAKILYLADKLDPKRDYDTSAMLAYAHKDIHACFLLEKQRAKEFHEKRNQDGK